MAIIPGTDIGRYHTLEQLGEGGMAVVYKAYDTRLEREVALKIIRTENILPKALERATKRFKIEAKKMASLSHPNIVRVMDYGEFQDMPYLVMEFLPGGTLKQMLGKPIPWQMALQLLQPIANALSYAHQKGLVHRDVKPSNILISEAGTPYLSDFGIAKVLENEETLDLTSTGMGVGTPEYMSPEQAEGKKVDARSDIYSLGIVLYELLTGRKPFSADTPMAVIVKQLRDPLPDPRKFIPDLPKSIEQMLFKALAKQPNDRYADMKSFATAFEKALKADAGTVREVKRPEITPSPEEAILPGFEERTYDEQRPARQTRPMPAWVWGLALLGLVGIVMGVFSARGDSFIEVNTTQIPTQIPVANILPTSSPLPELHEWGIKPIQLVSHEDVAYRVFQDAGLIVASYINDTYLHIQLFDQESYKEVSHIKIFIDNDINNRNYEIDDIQSSNALIIINYLDRYAIGIYNYLTGDEFDYIGPTNSKYSDSYYLRKASFANNPNLVTLLPTTGHVFFYNLKTHKIEYTFEKHNGGVGNILFSPFGETFASYGLSDKKIFLWNLLDQDDVLELKNCKSVFSFSPNGRYFAYITNDNILKLVDINTKNTLLNIKNDFELVGLAFSPQSDTLAISGNSLVIKIIEISTGEIKQTISSDYSVGKLAYLSKNNLLTISGYEEINCRTRRPYTNPIEYVCDIYSDYKGGVFDLSTNTQIFGFDWPMEAQTKNNWSTNQGDAYEWIDQEVKISNDNENSAFIGFNFEDWVKLYFLSTS